MRFLIFSPIFLYIIFSSPIFAVENELNVTGAGSSFAAPVYQSWAFEQKKNGLDVNYQAIGSGAGINQILAQTVDFAGSDKPLSAKKLADHHLYQFPVAMSGIVIIANLPGIAYGSLKLNAPLLAAIYDGSITHWDDPEIKALNPTLALPNEPIAAVHRADGSGTTFVFTSYLSRHSESWKNKYGSGTLIGWNSGAGGRGNDGVASIVRTVPWSITYVEYSFIQNSSYNVVALQNSEGYTTPSLSSFKSAIFEILKKENEENHSGKIIDFLDAPGAQSWPIIATTYAIIPQGGRSQDIHDGVKSFFKHGFDFGATIEKLGYVLPFSSQIEMTMNNWPQWRNHD